MTVLDQPAARPAPREPLPRGFVLRLGFVYWALFCLPILASEIEGLDVVGRWYMSGWHALERWVGDQVLGLGSLSTAVNGSGDKTADWVGVLCTAVLAVAGAIAWTALDRRRAHDDRLRELLRVMVRYTLAFVIFGYGIVKLFGGQFPAPSTSRLLQRYGDSSPMGLMWTFMGASTTYVRFSGAMETLGAALLLWRRTTTLGALILAAVLTNVVMMNFCYDVCVKINSAHYLAMCGVLLLPELRRLADVLVFHRPTRPALRPLVLPRRWMRIARVAVKYGAIALVVGFAIKESIPAGSHAPTAWYEGYWKVETFTRDGRDVPAVVTDATRWQRIRFQLDGDASYARWAFMDNSYGDLYTFAIDERAGTMRLVPDAEYGPPEHPTGPIALRYQRTAGGGLALAGTIDGRAIAVTLSRLDPGDMLLVSRGFHWINDEPFNR